MKVLCELDRIVGKFLQFERCGLNQGVGKFYDLERVKVLIWTNCRKIPTNWKVCIELNCRKIPTIWKMWIELTCRKIPTIWKICIELNCRKIPTNWKEWKFLCGLDHIVGKFLRFEMSGSFMWGIKQNRRKIHTVWKMWIEPRCRNIPTIWKEWKFWFDQIVGKFEKYVLNWIVEKLRCGFNYIVGKYRRLSESFDMTKL